MTLWQGRFGGSTQSEELRAFTESLSFDRRLAYDDITCSRAHVLGLQRSGLLSEEETGTLLAALSSVEEEFAEGAFEFTPGDEDIHTAIERRVTEITGDVGGRLHTGRSRNDQVATDLRLFTKRSLVEVGRGIIALQEVLLNRAREAGDAYLPGYTHMQRAQPVLLAHHLLAHGWPWPEMWTDSPRRAAGWTFHRWGRVLWLGLLSPSTPIGWPESSGFPHASKTPWTPCPIGTS